ncbi:MAG TPA: hypothetical protein VFV99_12175 [Kofleriaceae bacterium]|nr:hypothetical protein [Kofleriaceae bacterium]
MVDETVKDWITQQMALLIKRTGLDSYVAAPLVEQTDQWFPDEWHPDDAGVARLGKRVFEHAGLPDVEIATELTKNTGSKGIVATHVDAKVVRLDVDPEFLTDPLTIISHLISLAAVVFRVRHELEDPDHDTERRLIDLTTIYLGFGILTTNAAYRYRASGELQGSTAITRWSHDVQGSLPADAMAYALAQQLVARNASPAELRNVKRQLETNQAEVFETTCRQLKTDYVVLALDLPARNKWPAPRQPPAPPTSTALRLWKKPASNLPVATVKSTGYLGFNSGRSVLRVPRNRRWEAGMIGLFVSMVPTIALAVKGFGGAAMGAMAATWLLSVMLGNKWVRETCSDPKCEMKLERGVQTCPRCGGTIAGTVQKGENRLEAEERLQLNQGDYDMDVGDPAESGTALPSARVERERATSEGSTSTIV